MNARSFAVLLVLFLPHFWTARALAQSDVGPPLGTLYVSYLPDEYLPYAWWPNFFLFDVYVGVSIDFTDIGAPEQNAFNGIRAYEFGLTQPAGLTIVGATHEGAINVGEGMLDYIVGVGVPFLRADSTPRWIVRLSCLYLGDTPGPVWMEVVAASKQTLPGKVIWQEEFQENGCTHRLTGAPARCFFPFAELLPLCASNACVWATETSSWGTLKRDYHRKLHP